LCLSVFKSVFGSVFGSVFKSVFRSTKCSLKLQELLHICLWRSTASCKFDSWQSHVATATFKDVFAWLRIAHFVDFSSSKHALVLTLRICFLNITWCNSINTQIGINNFFAIAHWNCSLQIDILQIAMINLKVTTLC
jgi:hypothetical protein